MRAPGSMDYQQELLEKTVFKHHKEERMRCLSSIPKSGSSFGVLATSSVSLCETEEPAVEINMNEEWCDVEFEVALDSGSQDHVCDESDTPGYQLEDSPGSTRGQCFIVGNGSRLPNMGQKNLNLEPEDDESKELKSCFQIARVTRPLMSVGRICDQGHSIRFDALMAVVTSKDGSELCKFTRQPGGLYVAKLKLTKPTGFGGPE